MMAKNNNLVVNTIYCSKCKKPKDISDYKISISGYTCNHCIQMEILTEKDIQNEPSILSEVDSSIKKSAGWHFMAEYVDSEGNVYFKGKEQPELKGTRNITTVDVKKKEEKKQSKIDSLGDMIAKKDDLFNKVIGFYYAKKGDKKKISHMEKEYRELEEQIAKVYRTMEPAKLKNNL